MTKPALHTAGTTPLTTHPAARSAAAETTTAADARAQGTAGTTILGLFAIPLGVAGLGGVWQALRITLAAPAWPAEVLFGISAGIWIALTAAYLASGIRRPGSFTADRKHAIYGPFAAYIPIIGISGLPASLQTPDGLARAVLAIYDGATTELLLDNDPARFRSWLADLLTALLEHPASRGPHPARDGGPQLRSTR